MQPRARDCHFSTAPLSTNLPGQAVFIHHHFFTCHSSCDHESSMQGGYAFPDSKKLHEQPSEESMAVTSFEKRRRPSAALALFLVALISIPIPASSQDRDDDGASQKTAT